MLKLGDAFRLQWYRDKRAHIWVVAYHADDTLVIFCFSPWASWKDHSCRIEIEEYPEELTETSVVLYELAQVFKGPKEIARLNNYGVDRILPTPVSQPLLERIVHGATSSELINPHVKEYFLLF
jgi:hypothetical protein